MRVVVENHQNNKTRKRKRKLKGAIPKKYSQTVSNLVLFSAGFISANEFKDSTIRFNRRSFYVGRMQCLIVIPISSFHPHYF